MIGRSNLYRLKKLIKFPPLVMDFVAIGEGFPFEIKRNCKGSIFSPFSFYFKIVVFSLAVKPLGAIRPLNEDCLDVVKSSFCNLNAVEGGIIAGSNFPCVAVS